MKVPKPDQWTEDDRAVTFLDELARHGSLAPLHETLNKIVEFTTTLVKCDSCFIYAREENDLVLRASKNPNHEVVDRLKLKLGEGITGWVAERQEPVAVGVNACEDPRFKMFNDLPEDRFESFLSVPVVTRGRVVAVINIQNRKPHRFSEREIRLVSMIGALAGSEIEMARLEGASAQDTSARKKAEDRFYKAFNANPEPMSIATIAEERFLDVNESFLRVTGYQREEVIGRTALELRFWERPDDGSRFIETLKSKGSVRDLEIGFRTKSGDWRTGLESAEIIEVSGQECIIAITKDITERKILENQLRQSQKMEAVGRLSAGIAHDFNNLLGVIIGYSEDLAERLDKLSPLRKNAEQIKRAGERAASLTRQLLAFSRQQVMEPKILDLNSIIEDLRRMLPRLLGDDVTLRTSLDPTLGAVRADPGQIEQVILNLAVNARDAMPEGGDFTIQTRNVEVGDQATANHSSMVPGHYAAIDVSDTGMGMDAVTQVHIFEPFFTTKEQGKGTGLGLATVYGVVKQSGGYIWVESAPGEGTKFSIYLPQAPDAARQKPNEPRPRAIGRGSETILLVEDEDDLRALTRALLEHAGYRVLEANRGSKAVEIAGDYQGPIHLLLTDMMMPGMNGRTVAQKIGAIRPETHILYTSGYAEFTHHGLLDEKDNFLPKPFTREALLRKLDEALHAAAETKTSGDRAE
jgi:two-component system cell cycle sensor histidine kinase/response regulator CckA